MIYLVTFDSKKNMKIFQKIYSALIILACFSFSKGCASDYFTGSDKEKITALQQMITDQSIAEATLSSEYLEKETEMLGVTMTTYDFQYSFQVKNKFYSGKYSTSNLPTSTKIDVFYNKKNPHQNSVNPQEEINTEEEKDDDGISNLLWAIGWGIVAIIMALNFINDLKSGKETEA